MESNFGKDASTIVLVGKGMVLEGAVCVVVVVVAVVVVGRVLTKSGIESVSASNSSFSFKYIVFHAFILSAKS